MAHPLVIEYREEIIENCIRRVRPSWPFGSLNICPLNDVADILEVDSRNEAYTLLSAYHCVDYYKIPKAIRRRIPELIREAISSPDDVFLKNLGISDAQKVP